MTDQQISGRILQKPRETFVKRERTRFTEIRRKRFFSYAYPRGQEGRRFPSFVPTETSNERAVCSRSTNEPLADIPERANRSCARKSSRAFSAPLINLERVFGDESYGYDWEFSRKMILERRNVVETDQKIWVTSIVFFFFRYREFLRSL